MSFRFVKYLIFINIAVFILLLVKAVPFIEFNNDYWLPKTNTYQQDLDYLEKEFQPGFGSLVVLKFPTSFFNQETIQFVQEFKAKVEQLPYVFKINSPLDATVIIQNDDLLTIQTYEDALSDGHLGSLDEYQRVFLDSPYYGKLLSDDFRYVGINVSIEKKNDGNDLVRRVSVIESIYELLDELPQHIKGFAAGDAALFYEMDKATQSNLFLLLPLAFLLLIFVAWLFLKQLRSVLIVMIPTLVNLGMVPIVIVMLGHFITIINITLFILVLVITVADAIHMLNYWERFVLKKSKQPIFDTIRATWLPCFITSITTAVGFGSFATSSIIPLNQYGIQSFMVMIFAYVIVMTFVPFLLQLIPPKVTSLKQVELFPGLIEKIVGLIENRSKWIVVGCLVLTIGMAQWLWTLQTETSFISVFFKPNHVVRQNVDTVDSKLTGSGRLDVLIQSDAMIHLSDWTFFKISVSVLRHLWGSHY